MIIDEKKHELYHYGIKRRSGRYPWGSGNNPHQRSISFLDAVQKLKDEGLSEVQIAQAFEMNTKQLRTTRSLANAEKKAADVAQAVRLKEAQYSNVAIAKEMGINESSVRGLLAARDKMNSNVIGDTADMLRAEVDSKGVVQVGTGVENYIGVSAVRLGTSLSILKEEGYEIFNVQVDQLGTAPGNKTLIKVLAKPGVTYKDVVTDLSKIQNLELVKGEPGKSDRDVFQFPKSIDVSRVGIRYKEDGGEDSDGMMLVRPGVNDVTLGGKNYAQVRVAVNGTHYIKGMAMYSKDLPDGVDILFNTNKSNTGNKLDALKPLQKNKETGDIDQDNPFGASIRRQILGPDKKPTSVMNLVNEEGQWDTWSRKLSSQVLSKQSPKLAEAQLAMTFERKRQQYEEIAALTNPAVRKKLMSALAESVDSSAVHLEAAGIRRSSWHVILPFNSLKDNEIYAPNYKDGERVALIRYPHGGTFEIPELTVNNKARAPQAAIGRAKDAVGINAKVAARLSGADFDGDTVIVIPNTRGDIKSSPALAGLKNFDPKTAYPKYEGMKVMTEKSKGTQMGLVSNLITDMTIKGASSSELAAAVRHSMVVIDGAKHELNWRQSAIDNGIPALMKKYQPREDGRSTGGAATLVSRATSRQDVRARKPRSGSKGGPIDPETGRRVYEDKGEGRVITRVNKKTGEVTTTAKPPTQVSTKMFETDDANTLSSGTRIEQVYANHANKLKALANTARKDVVASKPTTYSPSAAKQYAKEVAELNSALNLAYKNRPIERQAQVMANVRVALRTQGDATLDHSQLSKIRAQELDRARAITGAKKAQIELTDRQWEAIQSGAIRPSKMDNILNNANLDQIKQLATPRQKEVMTANKLSLARLMVDRGYTQAEIAERLGVGLSTLKGELG